MKPFVIYFPQFYPTETNDAAWGKGFTDWALLASDNLKRSNDRRSPRRGFYDGSCEAVHKSQIEEMQAYGLGGCGVYHYEFFHRTELRAFETHLLKNKFDMPFFLIWATESWSKRWHGSSEAIIHLPSNPSIEEVLRHVKYLSKVMEHPDYLRVGGLPLFVIYNLNHFDDPKKLVEMYRTAFRQINVGEVNIGHFVKNTGDLDHDYLVDVSYFFEPRLFFNFGKASRGTVAARLARLAKSLFGDKLIGQVLMISDVFNQRGKVYRYQEFLQYMKSSDRKKFFEAFRSRSQEVVSPGWDNSPRYGNRSTALADLPADDFVDLVARASKNNQDIPVLINAWNEWSERAAIETCEYKGDTYLNGLKAHLTDKRL